ncbi:MAG: hypothetical protein ACI8QZ_001455 [Chlamydiales bacterium]|jgi:hypothetical protein
MQSPSIPPATLSRLLLEGDRTWEESRTRGESRNHHFVPSDHASAYDHLRLLRERASTFVELGSGSGVVTVMASLLGFDAYGIELDPWLLERSIELAEEFESNASFAEGSFVPLAYQEEIEHQSGDHFTPTAGACAYDELGLELDDFDLIFAYPWPGEEDWLDELVRLHARPDALLLAYDSSGGFQLSHAKLAGRPIAGPRDPHQF